MNKSYKYLRKMTPSEFKLAQLKLGLNNQELADTLDCSLSSVVKWRAGDLEVNLILSLAMNRLLDLQSQK